MATNANGVAEVTDRDHVRGPKDAAVTIIEYGDYACPHTRAAQAVLDRIASESPDVRIVFRHFPLRHLHRSAEKLARLAEAAGREGRFWDVHDQLMAGDASAMAALAGRLEDDALASRVEHDVEQGRVAGVHSTPTFFFGTTMHDGKYDYETLSEQLRRARTGA